tara:strand:- start:2115 stop:2369 length:255 start_codon:yes stop_codon:yes gene_type:complete
MISYAEKKGFSKLNARLAVAQTMKGSAEMIQKHGDPVSLIKQVASPNGTTEAGLKKLDELNIKKSIMNVLIATEQRSIELSRGD